MSGNNFGDKILFLPIASLVPYADHPFKLYDGEKFDNMVKSVKEMGIIVPIIVRPAEEHEKYQILSGHNRVNAAKSVELSEIPAIIKVGLNDDEAKLIITETNLLQRSFEDLCHSERAVALKTHMDAIKKQGKRNDLINEVDNLIHLYKMSDTDSTLRLLGSKSDRSNRKISEKFNISPRSIARYIRVAELIQPLQTMVDDGKIRIYPAVSLSYLSANEQKKVALIIFKNQYKPDMKKAEKLRELSKYQELTEEKITEVLSDISKQTKSENTKTIKIKSDIYAKYFNDNMKKNEIEDILEKALQEYFNK